MMKVEKEKKLPHTVALHGEDWCHLCGQRTPETLDVWGERVGYVRLCYDCLHRMYYMLRKKRQARIKREDEELRAEEEYFCGGAWPEHWKV